MNIKQLIGKSVIDRNAINLGKVNDIEFDIATWTLSSIVVKTGLVAKMNIGTDKIDKIGDHVILKVTKEELQK